MQRLIKTLRYCEFGVLYAVNFIQNIFRKEDEKKSIVMLTLDGYILRGLRKEAEKRKMSIDALINEILMEYVEEATLSKTKPKRALSKTVSSREEP